MLILKSKLFNQHVEAGDPPFSRDAFWQYELNQENRYLQSYSYPANYYNELKKISGYCLKNDIKLVFIISPTHVEVQNKIAEFKLNAAYEKFKEDIRSFGDLYDFNWPNVITENKNNFLDPLHSIDSVSRIMIREMLLNKPEYAVFSKYAGPGNP
jgi:hypothetical protein